MGIKDKKLNWALAATALALAVVVIGVALELGRLELAYLGNVRDNNGKLTVGLPDLPPACSEFKPTIGESIQQANCVIKVEDLSKPFEIDYHLYGMSKGATGVKVQIMALNRRNRLKGDLRSMETFIVAPGKFFIEIPLMEHKDLVSINFIESIKKKGSAQAQARIVWMQVEQAGIGDL